MSGEKPEVAATGDVESQIETTQGNTSVKDSKGAKTNGSIGSSTWVTDASAGLTSAQVAASLEKWGLNEVPRHVTPTYVLFLRQFVGFMPILIAIAAVISISLEDFVDFAIVVCMLIVNGLLGFREEYHAKLALEELSKSAESEVTVLRDGQATPIPTTQIVPGDVILLVGGTVIPADCKYLKGDTMSIDTSAMTGEPIPRKYPSEEHGGVMSSGTTVMEGECYAQAVATGTNTEMGKAQADIMADKSVRVVSVFQRKAMMIVQAVVVFSLLFGLAVLLVQGIARDGFENDASRTILAALSIIIASIPIALPLVIQVNMALGASYLAKEHSAIVTSIPALQDIASMSILCSDKTGTLTTAKMSIIVDKIRSGPQYTPSDVLLYAYLCSNKDKKDDPIDRAIAAAFDNDEACQRKMKEGSFQQESLIGFNPKVKRVVAFVSTGGTEPSMTIAKGLPAKIMDTTAGGVDDAEIQWKVMEASDKRFLEGLESMEKELSTAGYKTIAIACCNANARKEEDPTWHFVGLLPMLDPPREDTARTIESLHRANISVKMITGDHVNVGRETAKLIGLGTNIQPGEAIRSAENPQAKNQLIWEADGFAAVLPSDKREAVLTLRNEFGVVTGMTGDGVNDAAALSAAQVGIAVNGATDAAKNAADLILTGDGLSPIYGAVIESRRIFARIKSYIVYRVAASIELVLTLSIIIFGWGCEVDSVLVIILALLNDISMIPVAYDNAQATAKPQLPKAGPLCLMSLFFGLAQLGFALFLLAFLAQKKDLGDDYFNLNEQCNKKTRGFIWLHLVLSTELMIFSVRAPSFFFRSIPSWKLMASVLLTCLIGSLVSGLEFNVPASDVGWIWLYNIVSFGLIDCCKLLFQELIGQSPGEIIESDKIIESIEESTETEKHVKKKLRYRVHTASTLSPEDMRHDTEVVDMGTGVKRRIRQISTADVTDGYVRKPNLVSPLDFHPPAE